MEDKNNRLVSVIIPTFGRPLSLKRAIESVINQSYSCYEIIIVDDNNEDSDARRETESLMELFTDNENIIYLKHSHNRNGAAARNTGISHSRGEYLCFLDDDDWFLPDKLRKQIQFFDKNTGFDAVYCGWMKKDIKYTPRYKGVLTKELLLMDYEPITPTLMFKKEAICKLNGFDESYKRHQDYELMLRFFREGYKVSYTEDCSVILGENDGSNQLVGDNLKLLKKNFLIQFNEEIETINRYEKGFKKKVYVRHHMKVFFSYLKCRNYKSAWKVFTEYITYSPLNTYKECLNVTKLYFKKMR